MVTDFPGALSQSSSDSSSRHDMRISPLRLPIDEHMTLTQPSDDIPEDVESSRASSELEVALDEEHDLRLGAVEALSTPPLFATPKRFSTHLSVLGYQEGERSPQSAHHSEDVQPSRIMSQQSSLAAPLSSDAARSSFMTNTSRMSGLSDFPAPPTNVSPGHMSLLSNYYGDKPHNPPDTSFDFDFTRPTLVREPSRGTFGGSQEMGEAL
ncbi:hypothetical protein A0H81_14474 [Grifola frondosa]|uniref:Uncharacterized protein n=1 Tax=Grifola frondosa TaxID=5627 RepID=A0A1C7LMZ2_GRIFR|nr:hypothetical protein A0H81_14474 [Grifola frondosa]